jgi:bifunctional oligoribonuclease and PAP phosphatase NrnA
MHHEIQKFWELLKSSEKILLINHIRMDGDAWGSLAGLALILKSMKKDVRAINDSHVPPALTFLGNTDLIGVTLDIADFDPDIIISLDASDTQRLWESYTRWQTIFDNTPLVVLDHHISNPSFGTINIIDTDASSTCELLYEVLEDLHMLPHITPEIATFLYLGIQTDTNMYFNSDVRPKTLEIWAKLLALWADFRKVISEMFQKKSFIQLKLWEILLRNLTQDYDRKLSYSVLSREDIRSIGIAREEIGWHLKWAINELLINIEWTQIAFLIYPLDASENKVSMRAQPGYNVAAICETFWGGGHILAAGFQSYESEEVITQKLLEKIKAVL